MKEQTVQRIRSFHRFYLPELNLLGNRYVDSDDSVTEARVLFEIFTHDGCTAASVAQGLHLDKSYLSRVIRSHERKGYLYRIPSAADGRSYELHLTPRGIEKSELLIRRTNEQIGEKIRNLSDGDCERLIAALDTITEILGGTT